MSMEKYISAYDEDKNGHKIDPKTGKLVYDSRCDECAKMRRIKIREESHDI